jgi:Ca2+-binding EF-hand superfamily protein
MFRKVFLVAALSFAAGSTLAQSQDPIQQVLANFDRIDTNGDGVISRAEFRTVQAARWTQIDRNGDGYLGEDDFPRFAVRRARTQLAEIAYLDADGDGRISQSEFVSGPVPVFRRADGNADGVLTRSEVEAAAS